MSPEELADHVRRCMGGVPPMRIRDELRELRSGGKRTIFIRYDEIKMWLPFDTILRQPDVHLYDGEQGFTLRLEDE